MILNFFNVIFFEVTTIESKLFFYYSICSAGLYRHICWIKILCGSVPFFYVKLHHIIYCYFFSLLICGGGSTVLYFVVTQKSKCHWDTYVACTILKRSAFLLSRYFMNRYSRNALLPHSVAERDVHLDHCAYYNMMSIQQDTWTRFYHEDSTRTLLRLTFLIAFKSMFAKNISCTRFRVSYVQHTFKILSNFYICFSRFYTVIGSNNIFLLKGNIYNRIYFPKLNVRSKLWSLTVYNGNWKQNLYLSFFEVESFSNVKKTIFMISYLSRNHKVVLKFFWFISLSTCLLCTITHQFLSRGWNSHFTTHFVVRPLCITGNMNPHFAIKV